MLDRKAVIGGSYENGHEADGPQEYRMKISGGHFPIKSLRDLHALCSTARRSSVVPMKMEEQPTI